MLTQLQELYREAEEASEAYNATEEELTRLRSETVKLGSGLTQARTALAHSRGDAGRLAREQYRGQSGLAGYVRLLLARNPQRAMEQGHLLERAARGRAETVARLTGGEQRAGDLARASRRALDKQQSLAAKQKKQRDAVRARLLRVEKLLASLSSTEIAAVADLEKAGTDEAQRELISSGALGETDSLDGRTDGRTDGQADGQADQQRGQPRGPLDDQPEQSDPLANPSGRAGPSGQPAGHRPPSAQGDRALRYAVEQIGKPYEWGAEGPASFDCSGLTSQAWARAGRAIPRTSQEQWRTLPRVPLPDLRPGDLVIYFRKATHVAIYLGDGMVIQAPRPGARVKVSPIAANPLLGAVRPDPEARALAPESYAPLPLPPGAADGSGTAPPTAGGRPPAVGGRQLTAGVSRPESRGTPAGPDPVRPRRP
ncbi:NlpC/P60 family protein [Streptomyces sp. NPDC051569]|uniref:C40 family peptidase n=1 Tax=Streptomyces sp. NPDC051569 TaxID=3365661 RepID=UPI0037A74A32